MPRRPKKPCAFTQCPELVEPGNTYCQAHQKQDRREKQQEYDKKRPPSNKRGYNWNWRKLRKMKLTADPLCEYCQEKGKVNAATEVDHIDGNVKNLNWDNLASSCKSCHSKKTVKEQGGFGSK